MTEVTTLLQSALDNEPSLSFDPEDVLAKAHSTRRRRRLVGIVGTSGATAGLIALALILAGVPQIHSTKQNPALSLVALEKIAASRPTQYSVLVDPAVRVGGITTSDLAALVEEDTGVKLTDVNVAVLPPAQVINLSAGINVAGEPYLNVQVAPEHTMVTEIPNCAQMSDLNSGDGDGYYGPCSISKLPDGSTLVVRSGKTAKGVFTMAQALLVNPDGSGIFAENTNQTATTPRLAWSKSDAPSLRRNATVHRLASSTSVGSSLGRNATVRLGSQIPPVVRAQPILDAKAMASLVLDLSDQGAS